MANVWDLSEGFKDGLDMAFSPRERANKAFLDEQKAIDNAYKFDEQVATEATRMAEAESKRRLAQGFIDYTDKNPNALVEDWQGKFTDNQGLYEYNKAFRDESIEKFDAASEERDFQKTLADLVDGAGNVDVPAEKDDSGNVTREAYTRQATTIERYQAAAEKAPNFRARQYLEAQTKLELGNETNRAVTGGDYVAAYEYGQKAGVIASTGKLERTDGGGYTLTTSDGKTNQLSEADVQRMFFSQKTKEKLAEDELKHRQAMGLAGFNRDAQYKQAIDVARIGLQKTQITADARIATSKYGRGGSGNTAAGQGGAATTQPNIAPQFIAMGNAISKSPEATAIAKTVLNDLQKTPEGKNLFEVAQRDAGQIGAQARQEIAARVQAGVQKMPQSTPAQSQMPAANTAVTNSVLPTQNDPNDPTTRYLTFKQKTDSADKALTDAQRALAQMTALSRRGQYTQAQIDKVSSDIEIRKQALDAAKAEFNMFYRTQAVSNQPQRRQLAVPNY